MAEDRCRCGYTGVGPHPCHAEMYTCRRPAKHRIYVTGPATLPGAQMKFSAAETYACDECWAKFQRNRR
jgi:hypothetical protein